MMDKQDNEISFACDQCHQAVLFDNGIDFRQAWYALTDQGWTASKSRDGDWSHYCSKECRSPNGSMLDQPSRSVGR